MNIITSEQFFTEFRELVDQLVMKPAKLIMVGDFNTSWCVLHTSDTKHLIDVSHSLDLQQTISEPTHEDGLIINLVVCCQEDIICVLPHMRQWYGACDYQCIAQLKEDISHSQLVCEPSSSADGLISQYNCTVKNFLDKYTPQKSCLVVEHPWHLGTDTENI